MVCSLGIYCALGQNQAQGMEDRDPAEASHSPSERRVGRPGRSRFGMGAWQMRPNVRCNLGARCVDMWSATRRPGARAGRDWDWGTGRQDTSSRPSSPRSTVEPSSPHEATSATPGGGPPGIACLHAAEVHPAARRPPASSVPSHETRYFPAVCTSLTNWRTGCPAMLCRVNSTAIPWGTW